MDRLIVPSAGFFLQVPQGGERLAKLKGAGGRVASISMSRYRIGTQFLP